MADTYHPNNPACASLTSDDYYANGGQSQRLADRTNGDFAFGVVFHPSIHLDSAFTPAVLGTVVAMELGPPGTVGSGTWPEDYKPAQRVPSHTLSEYLDAELAAEGIADAQWHPLSDAPPTPAVAWMPPTRKQRPPKVVVRASMDCVLPALESEIEAHVQLRAVLRGAVDVTLPALRGWGDASVLNSGQVTGTPLPVLTAHLRAAAVIRASTRSTAAPLSSTARARTRARADLRADVAAAGTGSATVSSAARSDAALPAADIRMPATGRQLPPTDLDAELLLIAAQLLDDDEEDDLG